MNLFQRPVTRRSALCVIGGGAVATAVAAAGGMAYILSLSVTGGDGAAASADTDQQSDYPIGGSGLFDVDPDQDDLSQDPDVSIHGDIASLPEDMEL